jgi:hypothetical protein
MSTHRRALPPSVLIALLALTFETAVAAEDRATALDAAMAEAGPPRSG